MRNYSFKKKCLSAVLACTLLFTTGCDSIVKNAKPPKQYEKSQVLDGNFTDFSDPEAVAALYKAHYDSLVGNSKYTSYSALRGGIDIFGVRPEWSKNLINFQVVGFNTKRDQLIYSYQTTYLGGRDSNEDSEFGYQVKKSDSDKKTYTVEADSSVISNYGLVTVVGLYDCRNGKSKFIFLDEEKNRELSASNAGDGIYSLQVNYYEKYSDTICILYRNKIQFYFFDSSSQEYMPEWVTYDLNSVFSSSAFVTSLKALSEKDTPVNSGGAITPDSNVYLQEVYVNYNTYRILPLGDTGMTTGDQARIDTFMKMVEEEAPIIYTDRTDPERKQVVHPQNDRTVKAIAGDLTDFFDTFNRQKRAGLDVDLQWIQTEDTAVKDAAAAQNIQLLDNWWNWKAFSNVINNYETYNMEWAFQITFKGEVTRRYAILVRTHFVSNNLRYERVNWGEGKFTIQNIQYVKNEDRLGLVPCWIQVAYSVADKPESKKKKITEDNLDQVLADMEAASRTTLSGAARWLTVKLDVISTQYSQSVTVNEVQEIDSPYGVDKLMEEEKKKIEAEILQLEGRLHKNRDVTCFIEEQHLRDLEEDLARIEEEAEKDQADPDAEDEPEKVTLDPDEEEETEASTSNQQERALTARFTPKGQPLLSADQAVLDPVVGDDQEGASTQGRRLLDKYREVYKDQEKIKKQIQFLAACQVVENNSYYSQLLTLMSTKLSDYEARKKEEAEKSKLVYDEAQMQKVKEALTRMLTKRNLSGTGQEGSAVTDWISLVGTEKDRIFTAEQASDVKNWEKLRTELDQDNENNRLIKYLSKNSTAIEADLLESHADLMLLADLASYTAGQVQLITDIQNQAESEPQDMNELQSSLFTNGYQNVLSAYQDASDAIGTVQVGLADMKTARAAFYQAETDQVSISRYDNVSDKKTALYEECDEMGKLLKTIYFGSTDTDRKNAQTKLTETDWNIDINISAVQNKIIVSHVKTMVVVSVDSLWTATVLSAEDSGSDYHFYDNAANVKIGTMQLAELDSSLSKNAGKDQKDHIDSSSDEVGNYVMFLPSLKTSFTNAKSTAGKEWALELNNSTPKYGKNIDQAVFAWVYYQYGTAPFEIALLSQSEGAADASGNVRNPYFCSILFQAWDPDKQSMSEAPRHIEAVDEYDPLLRREVAADYKTVYEKSEMSEKEADINAKKIETAKVTYEVKNRGLLGENNTIFLDNPKITSFKQDRVITFDQASFYFLNVSLDEGVQMYSLNFNMKPAMTRLGRFSGTFKDEYSQVEDNYMDGSYFRGWWIPDRDDNNPNNRYNKNGKLSGGNLVLLGLSPKDMAAAEAADAEAKKKDQAAKDAAADKKTAAQAGVASVSQLKDLTDAKQPTEMEAAQEAADKIAAHRELVNDDIFHSKLYKIHISEAQMAECQNPKKTTQTDQEKKPAGEETKAAAGLIEAPTLAAPQPLE